jgi:hypothetical protein
MPDVRRIQLRRSDVAKINFVYIAAWRMRVQVMQYEGPDVDPYVFIYKRGAPNPYTGDTCDSFQAICGPADLEIPIGAPSATQNWPFYRLDWMECDFRSQIHANAVWDVIQTEVAVLLEGMGTLSQLKQTAELWIPSPPDRYESESEVADAPQSPSV